MTRFATALGLAVLVLIALGPSLAGGFVWDDGPLIVQNPAVQSPKLLGQLVTSSFWRVGDQDDRFRAFFRPVTSLSYAADRALWGGNPRGFHATNLLLHLACVWLVYRIAAGQGLPRGAAFAAAGLFAVHPVHVESVAWICGRTDVIATLLVLGAFLVHRSAGESDRRRWLAATLLFLPALFAKEVAAVLPALVLLDRWLALDREPGRLRRALHAAAPFALALAIYGAVRAVVLAHTVVPLHRLDTADWIATAAFVVARYVTLLVLPVGLDAHYPYTAIAGRMQPIVLVSAGMLAVIAYSGWVLWRRAPRSFFWLAWIFVALTPVLLFGRFGDVILADRFLYLPSVGLALLFGRGVAELAALDRPRLRAVGATVVAAIVLVLAGASAARTRVWRDDVSLFTDMARTSPDSPLVRSNLGLAYYARGEYERAIHELHLAIASLPSFAMAHNNLGAALERTGDVDGAERAYRAALAFDPRMVSAERNLGHLLVATGQVPEGMGRLRKLAEKYGRSPDVLYAAADAAFLTGALDEALGYVERLHRVNSRHAEGHYLAGRIRARQGHHAEAAASMQRFLDLWPHAGPATEVARRIAGEGPVSAHR